MRFRQKFVVWAFIFLCWAYGSALAQSDVENERLARWYINYAGYLIDVGKYMEALESYETAFEISKIPAVKAEALLAKATLLATFLDAFKEALKVYEEIEREYPQKKEVALYRQGLLLFDLGKKEEAKRVLKRYLRAYPQGRFRFQAEALLQRLPSVTIPPPLEVKERPEVRVRLAKGITKVQVKGNPVCTEGLGCSPEFAVNLTQGVLWVNGRSVKGVEVCYYGPEPLTVQAGKKKKRVRGRVCVSIYRGKLLVVNRVDIEDYLLSVVPSESIPSWSLETLKAQAVAARTYAYYQLLHRQNKPYDLVDNEGDQVYGGVDREYPKTTKAVKLTQGEVLVYKGRPILAMYMANSGGHTADPRAVFNLSKPYLVARPDPASLKGKMARWKRVFTVEEVEKRLKRIGIKVNGLTSIEPAKTGPSGRIIKVKLITTRGSKILRTRTTLRRALKLPDILLSIKKVNNKFVFKGGGFGHGVGYSQWGAAIMGKTHSYLDILSFYYSEAELKKLW